MANPYAGESALTLNGHDFTCRLTLGSLVELENSGENPSLLAIIERFENKNFTASDVFDLLFAGLRGGGWTGTRDDLLSAQIEGGIGQAARVAAQLLFLAFAAPDET